MIGALSNHLWQSTVFSAAVALLAIAFRENRARVRYRLWVLASVKFLIPFAPLFMLGTALQSARSADVTSPLVLAVARIGQPLLEGPLTTTAAVPTVSRFDVYMALMGAVWASGLTTIVFLRLRTWARIRAAIRLGTPIAMPHLKTPADLRISAVPSLFEPAVVGIWRPMLVLPRDLDEHLTRAELGTVIAHELCHVRHRDNLTAAIHMCVEALFWFHPGVWLIGARMIDERERACDEEVLTTTGTPQVYAEAILNVCKSYLAVSSPVTAGVSGANLRARIEAIMINQVGRGMTAGRKIALATAAILSLALPVVTGATRATPVLALRSPQRVPDVQRLSPALAQSADRSFDVVSIKRNMSAEQDLAINRLSGSTFDTTNVAMLGVIMRAYQVKNVIGAPDWVESERYDIVAKAAGKPAAEEVNAMLRTMFKERLKLAAHIEAREIPVFALEVARPNHRGLKPFTLDCDAIRAQRDAALKAGQLPPTADSNGAPLCGYTWAGGINSGGITMQAFAGMLDYVAGRVVVDRTGLPGRYEFSLRFVPPGRPPAVGSDDPPDFFTALQEQVGLRLKASRAAVDTLVVDHIERPEEN